MGWADNGFFLTALENSSGCVKVLDLEGRLLFMNSAGRCLMEVDDFSQVEGRLWASFWPEYARPQIARALAAALGGDEQRLKADCPTAKGTLKSWQVTVSPLIEDGLVVAVLATSEDITESLRRERELDRSIAGLRSANSIAKVGSWEFNCLTEEVYFSLEAATLMGWGQPERFRREEAELAWIEIDRSSFHEALDAAIEDGSRLEFEGRVRTASGVRWIRVLGEPEIVGEFCVSFTGAVQDVTDWRDAMEKLRASEKAAQAATEAMSNFLATMSHEIRTPLNGIIGMADAIGRGDLSPVQRERLAVVERSGQVLLTLLNDLLDLSRIQEGQLALEDGVVSGRDLVDSASATFEALVRDKDVCFTLDVGDARACHWRGDQARLRQIINNLIANAVKFTDRGTVQLKLGHDGQNLIAVVQDTGVGVPAVSLPHIFDRFVQADASTTRKYGGSGLGLAISRELAQRMGGSIDVRSVEGEGSAFTLWIPAQPVEMAVTHSATQADTLSLAEAQGPLRILAAEDNATNRLVLATLLAELGLEATFVENGEQAVQAWRAQSWDLMLLDIQMPVMDGVTATRLIRSEERALGRAAAPIVALTANAMEHQLASYVEAGMDGLIAKPVSVAGLIAGLNSVFASSGESREAA
ncbi:MAG: ATP-binding protein [Phenylobacterium sp.]|uniref:PAS domain-containing hybrid sensor histidine kinase/response regulator n=1 Tax=Phenylobacterium sp. TaxID=1871053 RepID=UPI0027351AB4|nr:PAS domain-containing hybrid sensor histidine kinase/response regulator [Phenylobacterium sp.]MDP3175542.1 ATP-binding protein [Phenylobacterium sp.]